MKIPKILPELWKKNRKIVYKVVRKPDPKRNLRGRRLSGIISDSTFEVIYPINGWAEGLDGTKLMAFETVDSARQFAGGHYRREGTEIWRAQAEEVTTCVRLRMGGANGKLKEQVFNFWQRAEWWRFLSDRSLCGPRAPRGSVACKRIKLLTKVANPKRR